MPMGLKRIRSTASPRLDTGPTQKNGVMEVLLRTDRLVLRRFSEADAEHLADLDSDPEVMRFLTGGAATPRDTIEKEVLPGWLEEYRRSPGFGHWAAVERATGEFLGWFELVPLNRAEPGVVELGYRLRHTAWGKGYATEGSRALIERAFTEPAVRRIVAFTMAINTRSRRVMEAIGMRFVRTFHQSWPDPIPGTEQGEVEYELRREDWLATSNR